jgi:phage protein D
MSDDLTAIEPASRDPFIMPIPDWQVTLDGVDLTDKMRPILIELTLTEKRGEEADTIDITLGDEDGKLTIPPASATLNVALGWKQGTGITAGLVDKGSFRVDDVNWGGPPDHVAITGHAADLTSGLRQRRSFNWTDKTLKEIVSTIAGRHGLKPMVNAALGSTKVKALRQQSKSDMAFITQLARRYDAVATVKNGALIFAPIGSGTTPSGKALPSIEIGRDMTSGCRWTRQKRDEHEAVEAKWHDKKSGKRNTVKVGSGDNVRTLKRTYSNEADARAAANGAMKRDARNAATIELQLALGDASLIIDQPVQLRGFKSEIDAASWQIAEISHSIGAGGFVTSVMLDLAP